MEFDLTADSRRFEYVHRLNNRWIGYAETVYHLRELGGVRKLIEYGIQIMHRMPDLVQAVYLCLAEFTGFIERVVFEEKPYLVTRFNEIRVGELLLVSRRKDALDDFRIEFVDELAGPRAQRITFFCGYEVFENQYSGIDESLSHFVSKKAPFGRSKSRQRRWHPALITNP